MFGVGECVLWLREWGRGCGAARPECGDDEHGDEEQTDAAPEPRTTATVGNDGGYGKSARDGLKQLIEGKAAGR